jgi:PAS domain S-box-containing protein
MIFAIFISGIIYVLFSREFFVKKQFADLFREEEKKFQLLFENANEAILLIKEQFIIDCNLKSCEIFNCSKYDLVGKSFLKLSAESKNVETILEFIKQSGSKPQRFEWRYNRIDKVPFYAEVTLNQIDISGFHFIQVFIKDISDLKESQKAVTESEEKFKMIFNSVSDGILIFTENNDILEVNDTVLRRYQLSHDEFMALPKNNKLPSFIIDSVNQHLPELETQETVSFEIENQEFARNFLLEMRIKKIEFEGKKAFIAVGRDISQRKLNQMAVYNAVVSAEELERSRVAKELHDGVSPILSTAKLYSQSLRDCTNEDLKQSILAKIEKTIDESIQSISEISNNLSPHILQNFGLIAAVQSFVNKIQELKNTEISIYTDWNGRLEEKIEVTLYRVVIELINNSLKHSEAGNIQVHFKMDRGIRMIYSDNGKGFNIKETLGQKKGMGLFNIINRVKSLNGTIDYFSEPGKGFKVIVVFNLSVI